MALVAALVAGLSGLLAFLPPPDRETLAARASPSRLAGAELSAEAPRSSGAEWEGEQTAEAQEAPVLEANSQAGAEQATEGEPEAEPPAPLTGATPSSPIIGANDGAGWGTQAAKRMLEGGLKWNRVELGTSTPNTLEASLKDGFKVLAVAGNLSDSKPLGGVEPRQWGASVANELATNSGISIAEAGNEMYLKGGVANPVQYGRMYLAAIEAMKSGGVRTPLLFNMTGDYPLGSWSSPRGWSTDAHAGGWLRTAVNAVPGLAKAILANGVSIHPYGAVGENTHDNWGTAAAAAEESVARAVLGKVPPLYITEFGYDLARCGRNLGACSKADQAHRMRAAYNVFMADANILGIWWYQSHDDGTGQWGFMSDNNSVRPSFRTLASMAHLVGQ